MPETTLPLAELHLHLEGAASPDLVRHLATRNRISLPDTLFDANGHFHWTDFLHFLQVYDVASSVIRTPQDYRDLTFEYLCSIAREGAVYGELMSSPDHASQAGMSYVDHLDGIAQGIADAKDQCGIEARIIVTCVRHFGVARAHAVVRDVVRHPHPLVTGFGMGGDEAGFPPAPFADVFRTAHEEAGLACHVHAGEFGGPQSIIDALDTLPVTRLGHGVRAIEAPALVERLADHGVVLEVCPTSNIATGVYASYAEHPLPTLLRSGVRCTLSSDDPPYFHTSVGQEYGLAQTKMGLTREEVQACTRTALEAAFVDEATRTRLLDRLAT